MTLEHQGGPMSKVEAQDFEAQEHFEVIIKVRKWDEQAKIKDAEVPMLKMYEDMLMQICDK